MRRFSISIALICMLAGCAAPNRWALPTEQQGSVVFGNPLFVPATDPEYVWETVVDVVDDYFRIEHEQPVRVVENTLTEGRLETFPEPGATVFEPWRRDSANAYERLESTLQSTRRRAVVRVIPAQGGYWIDIAAFKELENAAAPMNATAGSTTFRYETSLNRVTDPIAEQEINIGWIPQGRDPVLEQRMLGQVQTRLAGYGAPMGGPPVVRPLANEGRGTPHAAARPVEAAAAPAASATLR